MNEEDYFVKAKYCLKKAVENDQLRRNEEALENYISGIDFLYKHIKSKRLFSFFKSLKCFMSFLSALLNEDSNRNIFISMVEKYMARAEILKKSIVVATKLFKKIQIEEDSKGYSYENIFSECLDDLLTEVVIEEPYLIQSYQVIFFIILH